MQQHFFSNDSNLADGGTCCNIGFSNGHDLADCKKDSPIGQLFCKFCRGANPLQRGRFDMTNILQMI